MKLLIPSILSIFFIATSCTKEKSGSIDFEPEAQENLPPEEEEIIQESETEICRVLQINSSWGAIKYISQADSLYRITRSHALEYNYYVDHVSKDSIDIGLISSNLSHDFPEITAKYNDANQIVSLKRFYITGGVNLFSFEYEDDKIRVTQEYLNRGSYRNREITAYGDYFLDENKNIVNMKIYRYNQYDESNIINEPSTFKLFADLNYEYDNFNNPWKGITYPVFLNQSVPCPIFFSTNNITKIINGTTTTMLNYEYSDSLTTKRARMVADPNLNCISIQEETYSNSNCTS